MSSPPPLSDATKALASSLSQVEQIVDTARNRGYVLRHKNYRPTYMRNTRRLQNSISTLKRLNRRDIAPTLRSIESTLQPVFDINSSSAAMKGSIDSCRPLTLKLQRKADQESEILLDTDPYRAYKRLKDIIRECKSEMSLVDAYMDEHTIDRYVEPLPKMVRVRLLTRYMQGDFRNAATTSKTNHQSLEVRVSHNIHDRHLFLDNRAWIIGQSLKDAGARAPLSIVEFRDYGPPKKIFDALWSAATVMI